MQGKYTKIFLTSLILQVCNLQLYAGESTPANDSEHGKLMAIIANNLHGTELELSRGQYIPFVIRSESGRFCQTSENLWKAAQNSATLREIYDALQDTDFRVVSCELQGFKLINADETLSIYGAYLESSLEHAKMLGEIHELLKDTRFTLEGGTKPKMKLRSRTKSMEIESESLEDALLKARQINEIEKVIKESDITFRKVKSLLQGENQRFFLRSKSQNIDEEMNTLAEVLDRLQQIPNAIESTK